MEALIGLAILIGGAFLICLIATPFLVVIWLFHKWATWVQRQVNGGGKSSDDALLKELLKRIKK
jgi:hypothetical protein